MAKQTDYMRLTLVALRASARFLGSVLFLMIIMFAVGEGIPNPLKLSFSEAVTFFSFVVMLAGLIVAWKLEGIGGLIVLAGYLIFAVANPGSVSIDVVFIFPMTGILFIAYWWILERQGSDKSKAGPERK